MNQMILQSEHTKPQLLVALELSGKSWKLALSAGAKIRERSVDAGGALVGELELAKRRLGLPADAEVVSCYEAGRDGFWLHRKLIEHQVENFVHRPFEH